MTGPNHRQPIPTIVADTTATRHRVTPAVHDAGAAPAPSADLSIPTCARAIGLEAFRRQLETDVGLARAAALHPAAPHLDEAVRAVSEMLDGDGPGRLIRARDIVTVVAMLGARRELDARIAAIQERFGDRERVSAALVDSGVRKSVADWTARIAVDALADAGRL